MITLPGLGQQSWGCWEILEGGWEILGGAGGAVPSPCGPSEPPQLQSFGGTGRMQSQGCPRAVAELWG